MSEIEKMYENVGIEVPTARLKIFKDDNGEIHIRPPFTTEKQIELIKWLGGLDYLRLVRTIAEAKDWIFNSEYNMLVNTYKHSSRAETFEEALAKLINSLWQDLAETKQEEIRKILKG